MPMNFKIVITNDGIHGRCWIAGEDIGEGEMIWEKGDDYVAEHEYLVTLDEFSTWDEEKRKVFMALAYQVDENNLEGIDETPSVPYDIMKEYFVNHSCDGNTWYEGDDLIVARRTIMKGEEITYDYALTDSHPYLRIPKCLCGISKCRSAVTGEDWKILELQQRYKGHFLPYLEKKIEASNAKCCC